MKTDLELINKIKNGNSQLKNKLISSLELEFYKLTENYKFLGIEQSKFIEILHKILDECILSYAGNTNENFRAFFKYKIKSFMYDFISMQINSNENNRFEIINRYLERKIKDVQDSNSAIEILKKLILLLNNCSFEFSFENCIDLINSNPTIDKIINVILSKIKTTQQLEDAIKNPYVMSLIEAYCLNNNIEIEDEETIDDNEMNTKLVNNVYVIDSTYLKYIKSIPLLSSEQVFELARQYKMGSEEAKIKLAEHNLRLVLPIARKYAGKKNSIMDLIQEGNVGLMKSVERFEPDKGFKFSTYATWWIRQHIIRYIKESSRIVGLPTLLSEDIEKCIRIKNNFISQNGIEPSEEQLSFLSNIPLQKIRKIQIYQQSTISLNGTLVFDDDNTEELMNYIEDENNSIEDIDNRLPLEEIVKIVREYNFFKSFSARNNEMFIKRYGLIDGKPRTLQSVGNEYNITRERVRQITKKYLQKLKFEKYIQGLCIYTDRPDAALKFVNSIIINTDTNSQTEKARPKECGVCQPIEISKEKYMKISALINRASFQKLSRGMTDELKFAIAVRLLFKNIPIDNIDAAFALTPNTTSLVTEDMIETFGRKVLRRVYKN